MLDISVIIPVYNREKYIGRALRSILNQSIDKSRYEIIVIDDASTDNSEKIIKKYSKEITLISNKKNLGLPASLNKGINNAKGRFIIRIDSDDYVHKDFLKIPYLFLTLNSDFDAVSLDYYKVDDRENIISKNNCITDPIGCGIMFRHENLVEIGLYDEKQLLHEEKELRLRFEKKYSIKRIQLPLYRYRMHDSNMSEDTELNFKFKGLEK
tara:strand:+ start:555 stop:1187 length:633 start_codon:yes stop_codon:yes gene_type:complete